MYTILIAFLLYFFCHLYILRQIRIGKIASRMSFGNATASCLVLGYLAAVTIAGLFSQYLVAPFVPFKEVSETYVLEPVNLVGIPENVVVLLRGHQAVNVVFLVRYENAPGKVSFKAIETRGEVNILEDANLRGQGVMKKIHKERDLSTALAHWAIFDDGDRIDYSYELRVPKGSSQVYAVAF